MIASILPILGTALVLWSSLRWYWFRICDGSDECLSALALLTAMALVAFSKAPYTEGSTGNRQKPNWAFPGLLTIVYTLSLPFASKPVLGILMVLILGAAAKCSGALAKEKLAATLAMLSLALPLTSAFNFYCQWTLQVCFAHAATAIFSLYGYFLEVQGASLLFGGQPIVIDPACSGLHFIWFSLYLGILIAYFRKASATRTICTLAISICAALVGNLARIVVLSFLFMIGLSDFAGNSIIHQAVGASAFFLIACLIFLSFEIKLKSKFFYWNPHNVLGKFSWVQPVLNKLQISQSAYFIVCLVSVLMNATTAQEPIGVGKAQECWPDQLEGRHLAPRPLSKQETAFVQNFPGSIAKFSDGQGEVIFRKVYIPTRQLHPISECLRATGFKIGQESLVEDKSGARWNRVVATMDRRTLNVDEKITDTSGHSWPTIQAWYWAAILGQSKGPWFSITKIRLCRL
jgi:exosortase/archaeosortase family protein